MGTDADVENASPTCWVSPIWPTRSGCRPTRRDRSSPPSSVPRPGRPARPCSTCTASATTLPDRFAEWWTERGYDFYALDLRKYGRSLLAHQTPNYVTDLREHFPEIDAAFQRVTERDGHTDVVICAHSTGGLIVALWATTGAPELVGAV